MARGISQRLKSTQIWIFPFLALLIAGVAMLAFTAWLEGTPIDARQGFFSWLTHLDAQAALSTVSNAAEVVAGVLAIAITVVAIVVELAANRYTHRITQLFVREPTNFIVIGFFVITTLYCLWISASLGSSAASGAEIPFAGVALAMGMVTLCLLLLLPYFAFVFNFLQPLHAIDRIREHAFSVVLRAVRGYRHGLRAQAVMSIEQLEDVALNAMEHKDRGISMASIEALYTFLTDYVGVRDKLEPGWFEVDRSLARDPDFVAMNPTLREDLTQRRLWLEMKVLRQYHTLYSAALNRMRDIAYLISLNTHRVGTAALEGGHPALFDLAVRFFNSYLRAAINANDVRTGYYVLHHYRLLAEEAIGAGEGARAVRIATHLRYYGQIAFGERLPFVLEAVAYDMSLINEVAFELESPAAPALLEIFLTVDKESESPVQETSLRGVRRAQIQLATFFLVRGDVEHARQVYEDMKYERPERLASIREELLRETSQDYWEVTDRGVNFAYLPVERRKKVNAFFEWFGDRVPPLSDSLRPGSGADPRGA